MKKLLLFAACIAVLCGCAKDDFSKEKDPATRAPVVTLNIYFAAPGNFIREGDFCGQFHCPDFQYYNLQSIEIELCNVYVDGDFWQSASIVSMDSYSELVPFTASHNTYVNTSPSSIKINGRIDSAYRVVFHGINTW